MSKHKNEFGTRYEPCPVCGNWCDAEPKHRLLTGHHANCPHALKPIDAALELIADLARGMDLWGAEEDGIYDGAWEPYRKAKALQGVYLAPQNDE
jgi:hypothetical protein